VGDSAFDRAQRWLLTRQPASRLSRFATAAAQYALALVRDLFAGELSLRAMSLVYTSLLSVVPLLALAFSLLKALGVHNSLQPLLRNFFAPLGSEAPILANNVVGFVDNVKVGVLGSVGVGLLLYTAVSMIHKVETSCNFLWNITRMRSLSQRLGGYLSVMIIGPTLVFSALGLTTAVLNSSLATRLESVQPFGFALLAVGRLMPYLLMIGALTFLYAYIPNTRVSLRAAGIAGLVAGVGWQAASAAFASFVTRATNYNAIYSGFAIVIFVLIWLYVIWQIVLLGCRLAYYLQNPKQLQAQAELPPPASREAEWAGLMIVALVGRRFLRGEEPLTAVELQQELVLPGAHLDHALGELIAAGVLAESGPERRLLPLHDLSTLTVAELWRHTRGAWPAVAQPSVTAPDVEVLIRGLESGDGEAANRSVRDWLLGR
jgi:membrane protein